MHRKNYLRLATLFACGLAWQSAVAGVVATTASAAVPVTTVKTGVTGAAASAAAKSVETEKKNPPSLDGGKGIYALPPLPAPVFVRPGVSTDYQSDFPLSPKEIQWIKQRMAATQYAMHAGLPLTIENPEIPVSVGPGASVPTVHVQTGYVTTVSVLDDTGHPWPITSFTVGGGVSQFGVQALVQNATNGFGAAAATKSAAAETSANQNNQQVFLNGVPINILTVAPRFLGSSSNLVITLKGLSTPIMLNLVSGGPTEKTVDGMVTVRVDRGGPDTPPPLMMAPPPSAVTPDLLAFLEQVPPKGALSLTVHGGFSQEMSAWTWKGQIVVRSRLPLVSPAWSAEARQGGVTAYVLPKTGSVLVRAAQGIKMVRIGDFDNG